MERYGKAKTAKFMVNFSASREDLMIGRKPGKKWSASVGAGKKAEAPMQKTKTYAQKMGITLVAKVE